MIRCLLVKIAHNQRGQAIRSERKITCDSISIGRASECRLHLLDHRVSLNHAVIQPADDGKLYIESQRAALNIDGVFASSAALKPGMRILIGPYELKVESLTGNNDLTLSYELIHPQDTDASTAGIPTTLAAAGLSKRKPALWLAAVILLMFLVLPMIYSLSPALRSTLERLPVALDEPWNVGQMSPGHRAMSMKCNTCHRHAFEKVPDQACAHCHKAVASHIGDPQLHAQVFREMRCSACHLDHRGQKGLVRHDTQQCVACHGNIKAKHALTPLSDIHDFSTDHPAFQLALRTGPGDQDVHRIRQTDKAHLVENSGLKFSHQEHFDKALIIGPAEKPRDIQCDDCHKMDNAGVSFTPMTMPLTCQQSRCHALDYEPRVKGRQVPHGSESAVMTALREFYAGKAIGSVEAATSIEDVRHARSQAQALADSNARRLFTEAGEGTCLECHQVSHDPKNREMPWKVAPVRITQHWLPKARFPHAKHRTAACTDCHNVMHSDKSSDVAIPDINKCRECHVGSKQAKTRVSSSCDTCHYFHGAGPQQASRSVPMEIEETP